MIRLLRAARSGTCTEGSNRKRIALIVLAAQGFALTALAQTDVEGDDRPDLVAPGFSEEPVKTGASEPPLIEVSPILDFGYVAPESFVSGVMTFLNDGEETLTLARAKGDCECTVPIIQKTTLEPGEATDIVVNLDTPHLLGQLRKRIAIYVDGYDVPVEAFVFAETGHAVRVNGGKNRSLIVNLEGTYVLDTPDGRPFRVTAINGKAPTAETFVEFDPANDEPRSEYTIRFDYRDAPSEQRVRFVVIETDLRDAPMISFPAYLPGALPLPTSERWWPRRKHLLLPDAPGGQWTDASLVIAGKLPETGDRIIVTSTNPDLAVKAVGVGKPDYGQGMQIQLRLMPRFGFEGFISTMATIEMSDQYCVIEIFARVPPNPEDGTAEAGGK